MPLAPPAAVYAPSPGIVSPARPPAVFTSASRRWALLADRMAAEIDALIAGKDAATSRAIFNITPWWNQEVFAPNGSFFAPGLRAQLTGISMRNDGWDQGYGPTVLTPRHAVLCGHNGPDVGVEMWFVKPDGSAIFKTPILKRINDYPNTRSDDAKQPFTADLSIVLTTHELPSWVHRAPVLLVDWDQEDEMFTWNNAPTLAVSQGNSTPGIFPDAPGSWTPSGRMLYLSALSPYQAFPDAHRETFARRPKVIGDSGTPEFLLINGNLHLYRIINDSGGGGAIVARQTDYLNSMIARADAAAGISTGYTVNVIPEPIF